MSHMEHACFNMQFKCTICFNATIKTNNQVTPNEKKKDFHGTALPDLHSEPFLASKHADHTAGAICSHSHTYRAHTAPDGMDFIGFNIQAHLSPSL